MKTIFNISMLAALLVVSPSPCFALWEIVPVSTERAKELGMEVRSKAAGPNHVWVELEFKVEGKLKDFNQVDLRFNQGDDPTLTAALREDRSKPGRVVVSFTADRAQLDKLTLRVMVPFRDGGAGGTVHEIRVNDFVGDEVKRPGPGFLLTAPENLRVSADQKRATIDGQLEGASEFVLRIGEEKDKLIWTHWTAKAGVFKAVVELTDKIKLDDGSFGSGFVFSVNTGTVGSQTNIAGPMGQLLFREDSKISWKDGVITFADVKNQDGKLVPVSILIRKTSR